MAGCCCYSKMIKYKGVCTSKGEKNETYSTFNSILVLLVIPDQGYPALVNYGIYSYDNATGLNWLHLTETANMSWGEVDTLISPGGDLYGWRFATGSEFETMATALCANPASCSSDDFTGYSSDTNGVVATILAQFGDIGGSWQIGDLVAWGIIADVSSEVTRYSTYLNPGDAARDYIDTYRDWRNSTDKQLDMGSFLVTGAVPIPGAIWLLGSGLIGIVGVRRKFKK